MNTKNVIVIIVVVGILFGGSGFYGGMAYQKSQAATGFGGQNGGWQGMAGRTGGGQGGGPGGGAGGANNPYRRFFSQGGRPVSGQIISQDDKSVTIKLNDGSTKIIMLSSKTEISKAATGTKADLKNGERVMAIGTQNSDGSVTANLVSIGGRFGGFGGQSNGQSSGQSAGQSNGQ